MANLSTYNVSDLFKVNNKDSLIRHRRRSGVFIVNFEQIPHVILVFPFLTMDK